MGDARYPAQSGVPRPQFHHDNQSGLGSSLNNCRMPLPQLWRIVEKYASPSPMRFCTPMRRASRGYQARSMGRPTEMLLRMVESKEISAHLAASRYGVALLSTRSRMGLPYLLSPIWK